MGSKENSLSGTMCDYIVSPPQDVFVIPIKIAACSCAKCVLNNSRECHLPSSCGRTVGL